MAAAQRVFDRVGYEAASVRQVAREAEVDPALVRHYFADKGGLFLAAAQIALDPRRIVRRVVCGGREGIGHRALTHALRIWDTPPGSTLTRAMGANPRLYPTFARMMSAQLTASVAELLPDVDEAERQIRLAQLEVVVGGLFAGRYVARMEPLASTPPHALVARLGPVLQQIIDGAQRTHAARK